MCALTEDGRVFSWTAADATKARGSIEASLQQATPAWSEPPTRPQQPMPTSSESKVLATPPRPSATDSKSPVSGDAAFAAQPARKKQSISELKKSVTAIRAVI
jgi:hypothetical protein